MGGLYRQYLVESVFIKWQFVNEQVFPLIVIFAPSLTNLASSLSSGAAIANLGENKLNRQQIISGAGGNDRGMILSTINLEQYVGQSSQYKSGIYAGFLGAAPSNPATLIYLNFCVYGPSILSLGILSNLKIEFRVKFYDVQTPLG
jgi:hypothetical protein